MIFTKLGRDPLRDVAAISKETHEYTFILILQKQVFVDDCK
jgi:hypothetical protein